MANSGLANEKWEFISAVCKLHCTDQLSTMSLLATKYFNVLLVQDNFQEPYVNILYYARKTSKLPTLLWSVSESLMKRVLLNR
jgi:hypothetical protein